MEQKWNLCLESEKVKNNRVGLGGYFWCLLDACKVQIKLQTFCMHYELSMAHLEAAMPHFFIAGLIRRSQARFYKMFFRFFVWKLRGKCYKSTVMKIKLKNQWRDMCTCNSLLNYLVLHAINIYRSESENNSSVHQLTSPEIGCLHQLSNPSLDDWEKEITER